MLLLGIASRCFLILHRCGEVAQVSLLYIALATWSSKSVKCMELVSMSYLIRSVEFESNNAGSRRLISFISMTFLSPDFTTSKQISSSESPVEEEVESMRQILH